MKAYLTLVFILIFFAKASFGQQIIEGRVIDKDSKMPVGGAVIFVDGVSPMITTMSDADGNFILNNVPIGRHTLKAQKSNYELFFASGILVLSTKETFVDVKMRKVLDAKSASKSTLVFEENRPGNDNLTMSARSFSAEETERYAGAIDDPQRMALTFAGVQSFRDSENDLVIRGNLSNRLGWRLEGLAVPNPNQFFRTGGGGGAISILNSSLLNYSDLSTGLFSAEYGNASGGIFDMNFRRGNLKKRNYSVWASLFSIGATTTGPIKKDRSSYLVNYRYSTLGLLGALGLNLVRENALFTFQDLSFNLKFYSKDYSAQTSVFGVGALGNGQWYVKPDSNDWKSRLDFTAIDFQPKQTILGINHSRLINEKSYLEIIGGFALNHFLDNQDNAALGGKRVFTNNFVNGEITLAGHYRYSANQHIQLKTGLIAKSLLYKLNYEEYDYGRDTMIQYLDEQNYTTFLPQAYVQSSFKISKGLQLNVGLRAMYFSLNGSFSVDPRASVMWQVFPTTRLSAAYGIYSSILPIGTYLLRLPSSAVEQPNRNLPMVHTQQAGVAIKQNLGANLTATLEGYYQLTNNAPISTDSLRSFWLYNYRDVYGKTELESTSKAENYGLELTIEKNFKKGYFFLVSGTYYRSTYTTPEGEVRSTSTDNIFASATAIGKEFYLKKNGILQLGLRGIVKGGLRYSPIDEAATAVAGQVIYQENNPFGLKDKVYWRIDTRVAYKMNFSKWAFTISLDVQNTTNQQNLLEFEWNRIDERLERRYNSGILPVLKFQVDF